MSYRARAGPSSRTLRAGRSEGWSSFGSDGEEAQSLRPVASTSQLEPQSKRTSPSSRRKSRRGTTFDSYDLEKGSAAAGGLPHSKLSDDAPSAAAAAPRSRPPSYRTADLPQDSDSPPPSPEAQPQLIPPRKPASDSALISAAEDHPALRSKRSQQCWLVTLAVMLAFIAGIIVVAVYEAQGKAARGGGEEAANEAAQAAMLSVYWPSIQAEATAASAASSDAHGDE